MIPGKIVKFMDSGVEFHNCKLFKHPVCYHRVGAKIKGVHLVKPLNNTIVFVHSGFIILC